MNRESIEAEFLGKVKEELGKILDQAEADLRGKRHLDLGKYELTLRDMGQISKTKLLEALIRENGSGYQGRQIRCACGEELEYQGGRWLKVATLVGQINLKRAYYAQGSCGHGVVPLDKQLGIIKGGWSPKMQEILGLLGGEISFERGAELLYEVSGLIVSDDSVERIFEEVGRWLEAEERRKESRAELDSLRSPAEPMERLYMAVDGMKVPLREGWRELKLGAIFKVKQEAKQLKAQAVSYFGGVIEVEEFGRRWVAQGLRRESRYAGEIVILGDGSEWIWHKADENYPQAKQIVDWYHAKEYLYNLRKGLFGGR